METRKFEIGNSVTWQSQGETQIFRIVRIVGEGETSWIWGKQCDGDEISMVVPACEVRRLKDA